LQGYAIDRHLRDIDCAKALVCPASIAAFAICFRTGEQQLAGLAALVGIDIPLARSIRRIANLDIPIADFRDLRGFFDHEVVGRATMRREALILNADSAPTVAGVD